MFLRPANDTIETDLQLREKAIISSVLCRGMCAWILVRYGSEDQVRQVGDFVILADTVLRMAKLTCRSVSLDAYGIRSRMYPLIRPVT